MPLNTAYIGRGKIPIPVVGTALAGKYVFICKSLGMVAVLLQGRTAGIFLRIVKIKDPMTWAQLITYLNKYRGLCLW